MVKKLIMKFDFGLNPLLIRALSHKGIKKPTEIQQQIIPHALNGKDVVACSRTGSGKTFAYLLPLLHLLGEHSTVFGARMLVVVPTRELALQVSSVIRTLLRYYGDSAPKHSLIIGGHTYEGQFEELASNPDILVATPGRLMEILKETEFSIRRVAYLVFDEADQLFEMGYREQLQEILDGVSKSRQTIMLSATMPESLDDFARAGLREFMLARVDSEYTLSNKLQIHCVFLRTEQKIPFAIRAIQDLTRKKMQSIIFVSSRYWVDYLQKVVEVIGGLRGGFLFGKMDQEFRTIQLDAFRRHELDFLVVTDLCARGIDIPDVKIVIHLDFPQTMKTFIHRCGRTARVEANGVAILLLNPGDQSYIFEIEKAVGRQMEINNVNRESSDKINFDKYMNMINQSNSRTELKTPFEANKIYVGRLSEQWTSETHSKLTQLKQKDEEMAKLEAVALRSNQKFVQSRKAASGFSVFQSKHMERLEAHPLFGDETKEEEELLNRISDFRPSISYFELKVLKTLPNPDFIQESINKLRSLKRKSKVVPRELRIKKQADSVVRNNIQKIKGDGFEIELPSQVDAPKPETTKRDFRDKKLFISHEEDREKVEKFLKDNKITQKDMEVQMMGDDNDDFYKIQKQVWDKGKHKFKKITINRRGERIDQDGNKQKVMNDKLGSLQKTFKKWKRVNKLSVQKTGTAEDLEETQKAKRMFSDRKKQNFKPLRQKTDPNARNREMDRSKLKTVGQIVKSRRKTDTVKKINTSKITKKGLKKKR